ncbi:MAG: FtsX-like permease family protein [Lactobacillaceae bacterium]
MLTKIAWYSTRGKIKDYLILFSGLIVSSSIFYMFQELIENKILMGSTGYAQTFTIIFQLGTVLLGMITFLYLLYANSFFMDMKRRDYGLLMMLGASNYKILFLNLLETLGIYLITTGSGIALGTLLSKIVGFFLEKSLKGEFAFTEILNLKASFITMIFFLFCFAITAISNGSTLWKDQLVYLVKKQDLPDVNKDKFSILLLQFWGGLGCLSLGYYSMFNILNWKIKAIIIAIPTIFLGSYFIIYSMVNLTLTLLHKNKIYLKKMNSILISQLKFRIKSYVQILTVISILFALSLGAITVGMGFKNEGFRIADRALYYDLILNNEKKDELNKIEKTNIENLSEYEYKVNDNDNNVLINMADFEKNPFFINGVISSDGKVISKSFDEKSIENNKETQNSFKKLFSKELIHKDFTFVSKNDFNNSNLEAHSLILVKTNNFKKNYKILESIVREVGEKESSSSIMLSNQKVNRYKGYERGLVAFEYMGFFLGISFLIMLTSCLMFKIVTGYKVDQERYIILNKLGATKNEIGTVIRRELFIIFMIPACLGVLHTLFGLQLFKMLLTNPYDSIIIPIIIFLLIYLIYYYITFKMYLKMVSIKIK